MRKIDVVQIDNEVPVPVKRPSMYAILVSLEIGESFAMPKRRRASVRTTSYKVKRNYPGRQFSFRAESNTKFRVWRTK